MSEQQKLTRQDIYERIRETSKEDVILSEMGRLGFWQQDQEKPTLADEFIARRSELQAKLRALGQKYRLYADPEKALQELHKQRKAQALEKREQTRRAANQRRYEQALAWHQRKQNEIDYLGEGYYCGANVAQQNPERLQHYNLPQLENSKALADAMGIGLNELRFLCFQKEVSQINHYQQFEIAKKSGGVRKISAPMPRLKRAQYWLLENLLNAIPLHAAAHGFVSGRNILSNALPHVKKAVVVNLDMQNFFPTIAYPRVKGMYMQLGYSEKIATLMALLSTEPEVDALSMDNETWYVQQGERYLPQGAPTSPAISNIICRRLDSRLSAMAAKLGFSYTRYADDMSFSADSGDRVQQLLWRCKKIVEDEGFIVHPDKTRVMRRNQKQEVTGVVVNEKPSIDRETLKKFRALLFQISKDGVEGKRWGNGELMASIDGYANFVAMIAPEKGLTLQKQVAELKQKYGYQVKAGRLSSLNKKLFRAKAAKGLAPRDNWWQAQVESAPTIEKTPQQQAQEKAELKRERQATESSARTPTAEREASARSASVNSSVKSAGGQQQPQSLKGGFGALLVVIAIALGAAAVMGILLVGIKGIFS